ncbi:MAG: TrkA family potassium uptake protein [Fimbriimonadaceae bacterium]|jgi:trk system potassium uptake protein TrkA|nr:TrkA family potassium uptake protein [Fimbriimonadaceae bacterium]
MARSNGDFAVIGLGRFGSSLARRLVALGHVVLGIDSDPALVQRYSHEISQTISLDSTDEEALKEADLPSYEAVVVAIGTEFESSLLTTVALKQVGVKHVICKAATTTHKEILLKVGADRVILPEQEMGTKSADEIANPRMVGALSLSAEASIIEVEVPESVVGLAIRDLNLATRYHLTLSAIVRGEQVLPNPVSTQVLRLGDRLLLIGTNRELDRFSNDI